MRTATSAALVEVYGCKALGLCTLTRPTAGVSGCCNPDGGSRCDRFEDDTYRWVAPLGTADCRDKAAGRLAKKPWEYACTVAIPHLNTPELLETVVALHRLQTIRPYIIVIDTGSPADVCKRVELLRGDDLELHFVRSNSYIHSSAPVTVAMDLAFAACNTHHLFCTHADVFPMRRDLLAWLLEQSGETCPAVGWEMSPRVGVDGWRGTLSHTATMLFMPTMWMIGATWSMQRWYAQNPGAPDSRNGWPDTETTLEACFRDWGVRKKILGGETNFERQTTEWWDHARSITGLRLHAKDSLLAQKAEAYTGDALADARRRVERWTQDGTTVNGVG